MFDIPENLTNQPTNQPITFFCLCVSADFRLAFLNVHSIKLEFMKYMKINIYIYIYIYIYVSKTKRSLK